jgi:glycosyltransferase involved in cell wall biosynthesis
MTKARAMRGLRTTVPQIIVPIGVNLRRIIPRNNRTKIVYAGTLEKMFGVDLVLQAFAALSKEIEGIELIIIGKGSEEIELRRLAKRLGIQDRVKFVGFIQKHSDLEKLVAECGIGVAIYTNDSLTYKRFTDVAKPKLYMACGLPVVITRVPPIAGLIEKYQAGLVINYDIQELKEALYRLLTDEYTYNRCRDNAIKFISMYDWDKIYYEAFLSIMNLPPHVGKRFKAT